jgi:tagatose 6-phosphate kinase
MSILDAAGEPLRRALAARPDVVKPNRAELRRTLNVSVESDQELRDAMKRLIDAGPQWAIVSAGKAGAVISDGEHFWRVASPAVKAVNPIGSGDALAGGLACAIAERGESLPHACKLGVACGAANAMTQLAGMVHREDVERLLPQVEVTPW